MKIIDKAGPTMTLFELGQGSTKVKFAVINPETGETITPFCKCKDYFTDMFWSNKTKAPVNICGFVWKPNQDNGVLDKEKISIAIKLESGSSLLNLDEKQATTLKNLLNKFEKKLKFKLSKTEVLEDKKHIVLTVDKGWHQKPYLVSALFFLIRLGFKYDGKTDPIEFFSKAKSADYLSPYDEGYFRTAKNKLQDLLDGKIESKQTYEMYTASNIHSQSGIVGYKGYSI